MTSSSDFDGCNGAYADSYFKWYQEENNGTYQYESCYPYTAKRDPCNNNKDCDYNKSRQSSYSVILNPSEEYLKELVYSVPIFTVINVSFRKCTCTCNNIIHDFCSSRTVYSDTSLESSTTAIVKELQIMLSQFLDTVLKTLLITGLLGTHGECGGGMKATSKFGEIVTLADLAHTI